MKERGRGWLVEETGLRGAFLCFISRDETHSTRLIKLRNRKSPEEGRFLAEHPVGL